MCCCLLFLLLTPKMTVLKVARNIKAYRHIRTPTLHSDVDGVPQFLLKAQKYKIVL
jgi:hypothetical protein